METVSHWSKAEMNRSALTMLRGAASVSTRAFASVRAPARGYHQAVIDHYETPKNVGSFDKKWVDIGTGLVGAPACGDVMKLQIKVKDGKIEEAVFKTFGCGSAIASSSVATEWVKGMSLDDAVKIKNTEIASHLNLPPVKLHCSMLAEDAIKAAVKDYKAKHETRELLELLVRQGCKVRAGQDAVEILLQKRTRLLAVEALARLFRSRARLLIGR
jgi:Fe-S cluster assembly scaffold IscU